jgi:hypothetical protein
VPRRTQYRHRLPSLIAWTMTGSPEVFLTRHPVITIGQSAARTARTGRSAASARW